MNEFVKNSRGFYEVGGISPDNYKIGVSARAYSMSFGNTDLMAEKSRDLEILEAITGFASENIFMLDQVHEDDVLVIDSRRDTESVVVGTGDGMITDKKGLALVIRTADCVPVFIVDEKKAVLGAVHSGWRSTEKNITGKCIAMMKSRYSCDAADLKVFILPSIGPQQYEVNEDVSRFFPDDTLKNDGKIFVDLWSHIERSAMDQGVSPDNIVNFRICNRTEHKEFFSHRYGDSGRNLNFAYLS